MSKSRTNPPFLNGVPELLILQLLSRRPMHGYELVQAIKGATAQEFEFGEGCVYPILHRLEDQKLLSASKLDVGGRTRLVYRVTAAGKKQLQANIAAWRRVVNAIEHALSRGDDHEPALA